MNAAVKWGLILGVAVAILGFIFAGSGLYTSPMTALLFVGLAIVTNVVTVVLALRELRAHSTWAAQLLNGLVVGIVGALLIFLSSWLMTTVVFPDYYDQMRDGYLAFFENAGMSDQQIDQQMEALEAATPVRSAMQGAIGTIVTSVLVAAVGGIFLRKK